MRVATVVLLWAAVSQHAVALDPPPTAAQLHEWAAGPCIRAAKHAKIDYAQSLDRAIARDPVGLAALLRFTDSGWFDGAAAEGRCHPRRLVAALGRRTILSRPANAEKAGSQSGLRCCCLVPIF